MKGESGAVMGWMELKRDAEGNVVSRQIYLNGSTLNANTMVHEMGHVWVSVLSTIDNGYLQRGLELAKKLPMFEEMKKTAAYGNLSDDEIAEEVLMRIIADRFEYLAEMGESLHNKGEKSKSIIRDLKKWFVGMFRKIKSAFGEWTQEELDERQGRGLDTVRTQGQGVRQDARSVSRGGC